MIDRRHLLKGLVAAPIAAALPLPAEALPSYTWPRALIFSIRDQMTIAIGDIMCKNALFEFNDESTRLNVTLAVVPYLHAMQRLHDFSSFSFTCTGATNPPVVVDDNDLHADLWVKFDPSGRQSFRCLISMQEALKRQINSAGYWETVYNDQGEITSYFRSTT